ncbi:MAG: S-layer homology domain-containing protein, partial [Clostridiales bacterium]|nr:S-layer homology domain-containing protein [Clostridiales bacterium]
VMFSRLLTKSMNESANYYKSEYYPDVVSGKWYANQVCYMHSLGVLADYCRDGNFRPDIPVTRAEFATLAAHFDNITLTNTNNFTDVPADHWAVKYINSAAAKGWIIGNPDGTFKPEANITRAEVVTLVNRMLERTADSAYLAANQSSLPRVYTDLATGFWGYLAIMEASTGHDYTKDGSGEHWTAVYE